MLVPADGLTAAAVLSSNQTSRGGARDGGCEKL
jgi:hypothetical protein